jgi:hypothetical protein
VKCSRQNIIFKKGKKMKSITAVLLTIAFMITSGCNESSKRGGGAERGERFRIIVPAFSPEIKQGETQEITAKLIREETFTTGVSLEIKAPGGVIVEPTSTAVKTSDKPELKLQITIPKATPLGKYTVTIKGTPTHGNAATAELNIKVIAP